FSFAVARYNPDGTPDTSFGSGGQLQFGFGAGTSLPAARDLALQPDGKIVVAGIFFNNTTFNADIGIARLNADGTFDAGCGSGGLVKEDFHPDAAIHAVLVQPDGKIVVAGGPSQPGGSNSLVARFNPDGTLDASFGAGGRTITDMAPSDNDGFNAVILQPDGKVVAAGTAGGGSDRNFGIARYEGVGNRPPVAADDSAVMN